MSEQLALAERFADAFAEARAGFEQLFLSSVEYQRIGGWAEYWKDSLTTLRNEVGSLPSDATIDEALRGLAAYGTLLALADTIRSHFGDEAEPCRE
jgi:hypothetical protein